MNFITKFFAKKGKPVLELSKSAQRIPTNLDEAIIELHVALTDNEKREFAKLSPSNPGLSLHLTGGMTMRNNWGLWDRNSPFSLWFRKQGIWHPDDMSAIIYRAFWCNLNNKPFDMKKETRFYIEFWKEQGIGFDGIEFSNYKANRIETIEVRRKR